LKVLKVIQDKALKYTSKPKTYNAFVSHLQKIKDTIDSRAMVRKAARGNKSD
jgi:hypothetical protein